MRSWSTDYAAHSPYGLRHLIAHDIRDSGTNRAPGSAVGGPIKLVAMASDFQFYADVDKLTVDSPAPVQAEAQGCYPAPVPGKWVEI